MQKAMNRAAAFARAPKSKGFALFTALVFLALTMVLALAASRSAQLSHTIAASERAKSLSEAGAHAALRRAERWLFDYYRLSNGMALIGDSSASAGVYSAEAALTLPALQQFLVHDRWSTTSVSAVSPVDVDYTTSGVDATAHLNSQPQYFIEDLGQARPAGGAGGEWGATGDSGYQGSLGMSPAGNTVLRIYRITAKSAGPTLQTVTTVQSVFAGQTKG